MENRIKQLRTKKGLSQDELAKRLSVTREFINRVENGKQRCSMKLAVRICEVLDCTLNDIFLA